MTESTPAPHEADQAAMTDFLANLFAGKDAEGDGNTDTSQSASSNGPTDVHLAGLRSKVADKHGLAHDAAHLFLTQDNEEEMEAHAKLLVERFPQFASGYVPPVPNLARKEGTVKEISTHRDRETREFVADLFQTDLY